MTKQFEFGLARPSDVIDANNLLVTAERRLYDTIYISASQSEIEALGHEALNEFQGRNRAGPPGVGKERGPSIRNHSDDAEVQSRKTGMSVAARYSLSVLMVLWTVGCGQKDTKVVEETTTWAAKVEKSLHRWETIGSLKPLRGGDCQFGGGRHSS